MNVTHATGAVFEPLSTGSTDTPTPVLGQSTQFRLSSVPEVIDGKVTYCTGIVLSLTYTLTQSGGTGTRLSPLDLVRALLASVELRNTAFGAPIRAAKYLGAYQQIIEYIACGQKYAGPVGSYIPAANGAYTRTQEIFIPLSFGSCIEPGHTAPMVALLKDGILDLNWAASSVLTAMSTGASFSALSCRASAVLDLKKDALLFAPHEWSTHSVAYSTGEQITFPGVGNDSGIDGTFSGAGLTTALLLTSASGLGGAFSGQNITAIGYNLRNQRRTPHIAPIVMQAFSARGSARAQGSTDLGTAQEFGDFSGFPYAHGAVATQVLDNELLCVPLSMPGQSLKYSKLKAVDGDEPVIFAASSGSGSQVLLVHQVKRFTDAKKAALLNVLYDLKIPQRLYPNARGRLYWDTKLLSKAPAVSAKSARFLPSVLREER
jgi:hypothetical protein